MDAQLVSTAYKATANNLVLIKVLKEMDIYCRKSVSQPLI